MKIIYNNIIPFSGYKCINLFGLLFVRKGKTLSDKDINHERIHTEQMKEMLYIPFYVWYFVEWLCKIPFGNSYRSISLEQEAYNHDDNLEYLKVRKRFCWLKKVFYIANR